MYHFIGKINVTNCCIALLQCVMKKISITKFKKKKTECDLRIEKVRERNFCVKNKKLNNECNFILKTKKWGKR